MSLILKNNFRLEKYLILLKPEYRKPLCRLRVSAHRLFIELGRYNNTPRSERICKNCTLNQIEDEEHFLIHCSKFTKEREDLFNLISLKVKHFTELPDKQKLFWILNCEELDILNSLGRFLQKTLPNFFFSKLLLLLRFISIPHQITLETLFTFLRYCVIPIPMVYQQKRYQQVIICYHIIN